MEILAQSSTAFVLTHNFQGTQILGASRGRLSDSVASCFCNVHAFQSYNALYVDKFESSIPMLFGLCSNAAIILTFLAIINKSFLYEIKLFLCVHAVSTCNASKCKFRPTKSKI